MIEWRVLSRDWKEELSSLLQTARRNLIISSPYITNNGSLFVVENLTQKNQINLNLRILTDLSPINIYQGVTDPAALKKLISIFNEVRLFHLPKLHAKVYVADESCAIITSANLTAGGLDHNYEYGIRLIGRNIVGEISQDITSYSELGAMITSQNLDNYCLIADRLSKTYKKQQKSIIKSVQIEFEHEVLTAEDELIRLRLAGGAMHTVFAKTILYLLKCYGPLTTERLHPKIQAIHPDLCDDNIDRVIDGENFGKKWKHAVRTAQQQLKKKGLVLLSGELWKLTS